jgi:hypothetical protein
MLTGAEINNLMFSDFGTPAVISQPGQSDKPVAVIFDAQSFNEMGVLTDKPQASIDSTDLTAVDMKSAVIAAAGETYRMTKPLPDGHGLTTVNLTRI